MTIDVIQLAKEANIDLELHMSIGREPVWIATQNVYGHTIAAVVIDHAARRDTLAYEAIGYLRAHGSLIAGQH